MTTKGYCVLLHVILLKGKVNPFRRNGYGIRSMEDWIKQKGWGLCLISTFNYMPVQNTILLLAPFYFALFFFFHFEPHFTVFLFIYSPNTRCIYLRHSSFCLNRRLYRTNKSDLPINNAFMFELINQYLCTKSAYRNPHQPLRTLKSMV